MANIIKNETGIYKDRLPPAKIMLGVVIERAPAGAWYSWFAHLEHAERVIRPLAGDSVNEPVATAYGQGHTKEEALYELFDAIAGKWADEGE